MSAFDTIVNVSDTVGQYTTAFNAPSQATNAELIILSEKDLKKRQFFRVLVLIVVIAGIGFLIYKSKK